MWLIFSLHVPEFFINKTHLHIPLIQTKACKFDDEKALIDATNSEALIFTSKEGVKFFSHVLKKINPGKKVFCTGQKTLEQVAKYYSGIFFAASPESQEGIVNLIKENKPTSVFYPHAKKIRNYLLDYLEHSSCDYKDLICYETFATKDVYIPTQNIRGYFFGSPSQVETFVKKHRLEPSTEIYVQGQITLEAVERLLNMDAKILPLF